MALFIGLWKHGVIGLWKQSYLGAFTARYTLPGITVVSRDRTNLGSPISNELFLTM